MNTSNPGLDAWLKSAIEKLEAAIRKRNSITISEFDHFRILVTPATDQTPKQQLEERATEYATRFDMFHPVLVYDINPEHPDAKLVYMIRALLVRPGTVSDNGPAALNALNAYCASMMNNADELLAPPAKAALAAATPILNIVNETIIKRHIDDHVVGGSSVCKSKETRTSTEGSIIDTMLCQTLL